MTTVQNIIATKSFTTSLQYNQEDIGELSFTYYKIGYITYLQTNGVLLEPPVQAQSGLQYLRM